MIILKLIIIFALEKDMRFFILFIILIINQGCENNTNNKNTNKKNSTYLCAKCGSLLYDGSEMFYENGSSKDFNNSIEKKVKILDTLYRKNYVSENNKYKIELFCT